MLGVWLMRHLQLGFKNLLLHKLRSLLTTLGVVFGVGSVIAMLAVGEGASREALQRIERLGATNIILESIKPTEQEEAGRAQRRMVSAYGITYKDDERIGETMSVVTRTVPVKQFRKKGRLGERTMEMRIVGTTPGWFELIPRDVVAGRVLVESDVTGSANVCVLTEEGARQLLATEHALGQSVRLGTDFFEVVGIVRSEGGGGGVQTPDTRIDAYILINVCRARFGEVDMQRSTGSFSAERVELHQLLVQVDSRAHVEPTAKAIEAMLNRFHGNDDFVINVPLALLREARETKRRFNVVLGSIAGISLLVGGIGIMNIMLASVTERTREIGIRRAIGARRSQIIGQFLAETVVLSAVGGLIGVGFGFALPPLITRFAAMETVVTAWSVVLSIGISVLVGVVSGIYPAVRAARLDPITALRHE
ncbi:MAG: macrolide export ATP-binding/permease MacB [Planctomycetaceae bacterium]|nr:macrolide export ATP-binding/permease MacB [Planctomycetaceae bacterium]